MKMQDMYKSLEYVELFLLDMGKNRTAEKVRALRDAIQKLKKNTSEEITPIIEELRDVHAMISDMGYKRNADRIASVAYELAKLRRG